jgi:predicted SAM-dependent methyltransferase
VEAPPALIDPSAPSEGRRPPRLGQLGSGASPYPQFVNVDINLPASGHGLDVRRAMPFATGTVDAIYTRHVLEHFYHDELTRVLADAHRALRPAGGIRILVPSLEVACRAYLDGDDR